MKNLILIIILLFNIAYSGLSQTNMYLKNTNTGKIMPYPDQLDFSKYDNPYVWVEIPDSIIKQSYTSQKPLSWGESEKSDFKMTSLTRMKYKETHENTLIGDPEIGMKVWNNYHEWQYNKYTPNVIVVLVSLIFFIAFNILTAINANRIIRLFLYIISALSLTMLLGILSYMITLLTVFSVILMLLSGEKLYKSSKLIYWTLNIVVYILFSVIICLLYL